ncbi:MAG TPA: NADH-quinone oxidoreductase subunit NuoH [Dehalococcoidia bacterium]|nr:NADH-quinone oxidoreductase subunit NuoH [Dehalococcoidia bacterium]
MLLSAPAIDIDQPFVNGILGVVAFTLVMTVGVMYATWYERKIVARMQYRLGPTRTGPFGLLQPIADTFKLLTKEDLRPATADFVAFELAVFMIFIPALMVFVAVPFTADWLISPIPLSLLYILAVSGLSFIGFLLAGWGSDSKYALLGGMRAAAQLISYEVPLILALIGAVMVTASVDVYQMILYQDTVPLIVWQPLGFVIFLIASIAEVERPPFDIPTGESEVAGGVFIEYSGIRWSMFQLSSYVNMYAFALLGAFVFLGGWEWPFGTEVGWGLQLLLTVVKMSLFIVFYLWVRASFPRLRPDQLMSYAWKVLIPFSLAQIFFNGFIIVYDLPDIAYLITSGLLTAGLAYSAVFIVRRGEPRKPLQMVPVRATARRPEPAPAAEGAAS